MPPGGPEQPTTPDGQKLADVVVASITVVDVNGVQS
jgi:hypothetical protein